MRLRRPERQFPERVNRILNFILGALCLLVVRSWHLAVVQHEDRVAEAERPKRKSVWVAPERGVIIDRFGLPLAVNREVFRASILYAAVRDVPRTAWLSKEGKKIRVKARSEYITALSRMLARELRLDAGRVEDLVHSKGALFPHMPCPIKEKLTLQEYHRLKLLEKEWPGLVVEVTAKRVYPAGPSLAHVVGYLGKMTSDEYRGWRNVLHLLEAAESGDQYAILDSIDMGVFPEEIAHRRLAHRRLGYLPSDWTGKSGLEQAHEQRLRGLCGLDQFEADTTGRRLRALGAELPVVSGDTLQLTLSLELQQEAERLLQNAEKRATVERAPDHLGGAIVALDPHTGQVLCLATTPSFDPNAFLDQTPDVSAYLENEQWIGQVWNGLASLPPKAEFRGKAEVNGSIPEIILSWELFLERLIGKEHPAAQAVQQITVGRALQILDMVGDLPNLSDASLDRFTTILSHWPSHRTHRLLALDLMRLGLGMDPRGQCPQHWLDWRIGMWRNMQQEVQRIKKAVQEVAKEQFHKKVFLQWRRENQKKWLAHQRVEEKRAGKAHRPFLDLLDREEGEQFRRWWTVNEQVVIADLLAKGESLEEIQDSRLSEEGRRALASLRKAGVQENSHGIDWAKIGVGFDHLQDKLWGHYPYLKNRKDQRLRDLAAGFRPPYGLGVMRSQAFQQIAPLGSVFKLVTAAEALRQSEARYGKARPDQWTIIEDAVLEGKRITQVGKTADGRVIPRIYQGGRLPLTAYRHFGRMDLMGALERSSNPYFALLTVEAMRSPLDLLDAARAFGFGSRTGLGLAGEAPGRLPEDLEDNRSGLYAFSIGQHEMRCTPLQAALMLGALSNGGDLMKPLLLKDEPRFVRDRIALSEDVRNTLLKGMYKVVHGATGSARLSLVRKDACSPNLKMAYEKISPCLIGKTGTSQILETLSPDPEHGVQMVQHVWFGGIVYPDAHKATELQDPELVVVVFLRFANGGREAAPLAARIAEVWREIRSQCR